MDAFRRTLRLFQGPDEGSKGLVFLVHGFLGSRVQMVPLAGRLWRGGWDVVNYGYPTRRHTLEDHALALLDVVRSNIDRTKPETVHFVSHSFGGVVLRAALKHPDCPEFAQNGRIVLVAPPIRGSSFARALKRLPQPLNRLASIVVGTASGSQLMERPQTWYDASGGFPKRAKVLLICGNMGRINPWIDGDSDGVVALNETQVVTPHRRIELRVTHNLLMYHSKVIDAATRFLNGEDDIGEKGFFHPLDDLAESQKGAI